MDFERKLSEALRGDKAELRDVSGMGTGWLSPEGEFLPVRTTHHDLAQEIITQRYPEQAQQLPDARRLTPDSPQREFLLDQGYLRVGPSEVEVRTWNASMATALRNHMTDSPPTTPFVDMENTKQRLFARVEPKDFAGNPRVRWSSLISATPL